MRIRPIGRFWRLDADGFIQNDAGPEKILSPYSELVAEVRDAYLEHLGQRVASTFVGPWRVASLWKASLTSTASPL